MSFEIAALYARPGQQGFPLNSLSENRAPTVNDDQTKGYSVGSAWCNQKTGIVYTASSVGTGTASWSVKGAPIVVANTDGANLAQKALSRF